MSESPHRVLIAGGGVAALEALLALRRLAGDRVEIELLSPQPAFTYRPLSVAEPFGGEAPFSADLATIAADQGVRLRRGALTGVDVERRQARTDAGQELPFDSLVVACGARCREAVAGATTFMGEAGREGMGRILGQLESGEIDEVAFALPENAGWPLPLYELALLTASRLTAGGQSAALALVTPESAPLELFGREASAAVAELLEDHGITLIAGVRPVSVQSGHLLLAPSGRIAADAVIALPRLQGREIEGLPQGASGFLPVDPLGRVAGIDGVYAAGDATSLPIKQGGLAAQQADAVSELIAERVGAPVERRAQPPVLRGMLLTGGEPRFMRAKLGREVIEGSVASGDALWWPPSKIAGTHLSPYLAELAGAGPPPSPPKSAERVDVSVTVEAGQ